MSTDLVALPDLVPARMVNEYVYCPRLAYLEWVQGDWADNADTAEGRFRHRVVDRPAGQLPAPADAPGETIHARSVWLSAEEEHLTARIDLIEGEGTTVTPVDYKRGSAPDLPEGAWETDRVQLCAQGLILRALTEAWVGGYRVLIHYSTSPQTARPFDVYFIEPSPLSARLTYVVGYDHMRGAVRTFALERILSITRTLETYTIPVDFDPYALLARAWGVNWGDGTDQPTEVVLRFRPGRAAQRLQESRWHATQRITPLPDEGCEFRVIVAQPNEMLPWIRQWGSDCEVIAPAEVRQRVAEDMRRAALQYGALHGEE